MHIVGTPVFGDSVLQLRRSNVAKIVSETCDIIATGLWKKLRIAPNRLDTTYFTVADGQADAAI